MSHEFCLEGSLKLGSFEVWFSVCIFTLVCQCRHHFFSLNVFPYIDFSSLNLHIHYEKFSELSDLLNHRLLERKH